MTDRAFLEELFAPLGGIAVKRMFGGLGVFRDGLMIALVANDVLHFKADAETIPAFEAEGSIPFSYDRKDGRTTLTSYWRVPERLFDEPETFLAWAERAVAAARRHAARPARKGRRRMAEA